MKKFGRLFFKVLSLITVLTILLCPRMVAHAAEPNPNTGDTPFDNFRAYAKGISDPIPPRRKYDSTPVFVKISASKYDKVLVCCEGQAREDVDDFNENLTLSNGAYVDFVTLNRGQNYRIRTRIYERDFHWATLRFRSGNDYKDDIVSGWWSPDSKGNHPIAE